MIFVIRPSTLIINDLFKLGIRFQFFYKSKRRYDHLIDTGHKFYLFWQLTIPARRSGISGSGTRLSGISGNGTRRSETWNKSLKGTWKDSSKDSLKESLRSGTRRLSRPIPISPSSFFD